MRPCPVCLSTSSRTLHSHTLTFGDIQSIRVCTSCGMVYADSAPVDYDAESIYALPTALGSGVSPTDRQRVMVTAERIEEMGVRKDAAILDIGCAQGALLEALRELGYTNLSGLDPSAQCARTVTKKGFLGYHGVLADPPSIPALAHAYDLIILSHVLEHVPDLQGAMAGVKARLAPAGLVYIEVPSAAHYHQYDLPFLDFNSEHINHFGLYSIANLVTQYGLGLYQFGLKLIEIPSGLGASPLMNYPALYVWLRPINWDGPPMTMDDVSADIEVYIQKSLKQLVRINHYLHDQLSSYPACIIWGAGNHAGNFLYLPVFDNGRIVQIVDNNPSLHGKRIRTIPVTPPRSISRSRNLPIVVSTITASRVIRSEAEKMDLPNPIITITPEVYTQP